VGDSCAGKLFEELPEDGFPVVYTVTRGSLDGSEGGHCFGPGKEVGEGEQVACQTL